MSAPTSSCVVPAPRRPERCVARLAACASIFGLVACGEAGSSADESRAWHEHTQAFTGGLLLSVWGAAADDVWVVGGRPGATAVLRGDRRSLEPVSNPGRNTAWWVCDLGGTVGIVGEQGLVMLERAEGQLEQIDIGITSTLYGCWGTGPDDFWVVGGNPLTGPAELAHVQDEEALAPDLGSVVSELPNVLYKVIGIDDLLIAVGADGVVLTRVSTGDWELERLADGAPLFTISGRNLDDLWLVGGTAAAVALHYDGSSWRDRSPELLPNLFGVTTNATETLVAGAVGTLVERRGNEWQVIETQTEDTFHAVWSDGEAGAWAVGGNVLEQDPEAWRGVIWAR